MPRVARPPVPAHWNAWLDSWELALTSDRIAPRTRAMYRDAVGWVLASLPAQLTQWTDVTRDDIRRIFAGLAAAGYAQSYVNNIGRCLQQWDRWYAVEEDAPRLLDGVKLKVPPPPKLGSNPPPIIAIEQLAALITDAEAGKDYESRRDAAILRLFAATGSRLAEVAGVQVDDVNLPAREVTITGKGNKTRTVRIDAKAARALDRYVRIRAKHRHAHLAALWIGVRRSTGMTEDGVYQMVQRRGRRLGLKLHPHLFRHTFAHRWLDAGGAEGDLMELLGWTSPQMLRHYGASARGARARRAYDRVDVMGGV